MLSVILPVLNEEVALLRQRSQLGALRGRGVEVIVVDGGSSDQSAMIATSLATKVISTPRGRASQMTAGAAVAKGDMLLFLHADTHLPQNADWLVEEALGDGVKSWGRFDVRIEPSTPLLKLVAWSMNLRSRLTGIATGDQAIFVDRKAFDAVGGYPDIPLMEDIALSKSLRRTGWPACLREHVSTSGRRWIEHGVIRTIVLMWYLRLAYFLGADPHVLARRYGYVPRVA